jgi:hypothetical protein
MLASLIMAVFAVENNGLTWYCANMMQSTSHSYADHILSQLDRLENKRRELSVEEKIISYLEICGPITSLFQFAVVRLGIAYAWAWIIVQRLEADGRISVERSPGKPLTIRMRN